MRSLVLVAMFCPLAALAGQVGTGSDVNAARVGGDGVIDQLIENLKKGKGQVPASMAALCEQCNQPLFRHADPNFECIPVDPRTGRSRPMPKLRLTETPVQCPVCAAKFGGVLTSNINDRGGRDRDFCVHSIGKFTVHSNVWMCPDCGYAGLIPQDQRAEGFALGLDGKPVGEATKKFVREKLSDPTRQAMMQVAGIREDSQVRMPELLQFSRYIPQNEIPDWLKYANALQIYEMQKAPHLLMARIYYEAAHACRRDVCGEIAAPGLDPSLQEVMGRSITRMNKRLQTKCLVLRRERHESLLDPLRAEIDPRLVADAAAALLLEAKHDEAVRRAEGKEGAEGHYEIADLFVLNVTYAGALDRLGDIEKARTALTAAGTLIPEKIEGLPDNKVLAESVQTQVKLLRGIALERQKRLKSEQEYMFKAAMFNMTAIRNNQVTFQKLQFDPKGQPPPLADPAPTSYLLGELLRRGGIPESATAWFNATAGIVGKRLETVDAAEKAAPAPPPVTLLPGQTAPPTPYEEERARLYMLQQWTQEQSALVRATRPPDANTLGVIAQVLRAAGLDPQAVGPAPAPESATPKPADNAKPAATGTSAAPAVAAPKPATPSGAPKTRAQLLQAYYAALMKFRADRKENPRDLVSLVKGGYIASEDSCIDELGKLRCPETHEVLVYLRRWEPGDKNTVILAPVQPGSMSLYADGEVRK